MCGGGGSRFLRIVFDTPPTHPPPPPPSPIQTGTTNYQAVANAAVTTTLAPAAAGLSALIVGALESKVQTGKAMYGVENMGNGALAGLAAITASCNVVRPWAAIIIGGCSGVIYLMASKVSVKLRLDDPLDAVAVHAWNGVWGVLAAGLFSDVALVNNSYLTNVGGVPEGALFPRGGGLFYSGGPGRGRQLAAQVVYAIWVAGWVLANMVPFWLILKATGFLRVPSDEEIVGLDHSYHGGSAYPGGPEEAEDKSLKAPAGAGVTASDLAGLKQELASLKAQVAKVA